MSTQKEETKKEDKTVKPELLSSDQDKKEEGSVKYPESVTKQEQYYYIEGERPSLPA